MAKTQIQIPPGWKLAPDGKSISVEVKTEDFVDAVDLFDDITEVAEDLEHHPDLHLEKYNHVRIVSWSHDIGGLSERDEHLAREINKVLAQRGISPA